MVLTLVVGGATRLTESGLSIVEWKPVTGVMPPMSDTGLWHAEFDKYKADIPQYRELNRGMSLSEFKTIYWWEWSHRLLARVIGAVFLLPFVYFLWRGWIEPSLKARLWTLFGAGAALGAVGWWMVSSGLADSARTSVSQYRLAFHLTLACAIYAAILWTAQGLRAHRAVRSSRRHGCASARSRLAAHLGAAANLSRRTRRGPRRGPYLQHLARHRRLADPRGRPAVVRRAVVAEPVREHADGAVRPSHGRVHAVARGASASRRRDPRPARARASASNGALALFCFATVQAGIGIVTLLHQAPLPLALLHQITGIAVLTIAVIHAESLSEAAA